MSNKQAIEILQKLCNISEKEANEDPESMYKQGLREWFYIAKSRIQSLPDTDEWIDVKDNVPDDSYWDVLCYIREMNDLWMSYFICVLHYNMHLKMWMKDFIEYNVTHWMPLPNIPNK